MTRAKFKVDEIRMSQHFTKAADNTYQPVEKRTIVLTPVYSPEEGSENKKFWDATPSGKIELGTINPAAWGIFEIGNEYYIDFTRAN